MTSKAQIPATAPTLPPAPVNVSIEADELLELKLKGSTVVFLSRAIDEIPLPRKMRDELSADLAQAVIAAKAPK